MIITEKSSEFDKWIRKLKDIRAKSKILVRIQKLESDEHYRDCKPVGDGIMEMRINYAKGYRVYFKNKKVKLLYFSSAEINRLNRKTLKKRKNFGTE